MKLTLRALLGRDELRLRLMNGDPDTPLTWVHGIELLDPTPYLSGGELVLTTGQRLPAEHDECRAYVQRLAAHDVGALGFGVGVGHDTVPDAVARACVEFGLPLLVGPSPPPSSASCASARITWPKRNGARCVTRWSSSVV